MMSILQVLGGDLPALHPLPQLGLHLDPHLRRLARLHHRLPRAAVRVEGRELGQQGGRWRVHGEERSGDIIIYLIITHFRWAKKSPIRSLLQAQPSLFLWYSFCSCIGEYSSLPGGQIFHYDIDIRCSFYSNISMTPKTFIITTKWIYGVCLLRSQINVV